MKTASRAQYMTLMPLLTMICAITPATLMPGTAQAFDFVISPQSCYGQTNSDNALIARNRASIRNRSRTKTIRVLCDFPSEYSPFAPANSCIANARFEILVGLRLRFELSRATGGAILYRTSDGQPDPLYYQARATLETDTSGFDGSTRYFPVFYKASLDCQQQNAAQITIDTEWWAAHTLITLPAGAQLTYVNYYTDPR
jgi:hypothetical protein